MEDSNKNDGENGMQISPTQDSVERGDVINPDQRKLLRMLQPRHMQMIAIGGSIGAGLLVAAGGALHTGGPGSLLIGFLIMGTMMFCTVHSLGELAATYPVNGAFYEYAVRFIDPSWGFAMGWEYAIGWLVTLPFELTAAGVTLQFWSDLNVGIWITMFLAVLVIIQAFGVRGYGEVEYILGLIKVIFCIGFIILGIVIDCGGVPTDDRGYIGARYWHDPGAFRNGFQGFCSVFVTAAFSFGGTELVGLAAAEAVNPTKSLPAAAKQVFWRIALFYILNIFVLGLIVPSNSTVLLGSTGANTKASPFVLAAQLAGIKVLPHIINSVITISVVSVANSCAYGSTRVLQALAQSGRAPQAFATIDAQGRPIWCIIFQLAFGLLAYISIASSGSEVFTWLLAIASLSQQFTYASVCIAHIRFRMAWKLQGRDKGDIPWMSPLGVAGSYVGFTLVMISLVATFYSSLFPIGEPPSAISFFQGYIAAPITLALYLIWKIYTRNWSLYVKLSEIDLDTGRRSLAALEPDVSLAEKELPAWKRIFNTVF